MIDRPEEYRDFAKELDAMVAEDQAMRNRCLDNPNEYDENVDHRNTERMKEIINEIGWPTITKVGEKGANDAWLLVQHADSDLEFQKKCLQLMKLELENEAPRRNIAFLEDRIALNDGQPQIYGTQFEKSPEGKWIPRPIHDPESIEKRRKDMGLDTLDENQERIQKMYGKKRQI